MNLLSLAIYLSFAIYIAGIIAIIRFRQINPAFYPFIYCLWIGCINEVLSVILVKLHMGTPLTSNMYVLFEAVLITYMFKNLDQVFNRRLYNIILISMITGWIIENFIMGKLTAPGVYFRLYYSFLIVIMSINTINYLITSSRGNLAKNSIFLLCLGFLLYFTYKVLVQSFYLYGLNTGREFLLRVFTIMVIINLISNLIYALAVLWMPRKIEYSQPL